MSRRERPAVEVSDARHMVSRRDKPVSRETIYRLITAGELEAFKLSDSPNSKYLIYEDSIEAYKTRRAVSPAYDRERIKQLLAA